jgi:two-component system, OmpR family, sensor histidine kinase KdpD
VPTSDVSAGSVEPGSESVESLSGRVVADRLIETWWTRDAAAAAKRAPLRVYVGAAPGVGKTYAMLGEGRRRQERGTDVVVALVETYGRPKTIEAIAGLEIVPPRRLEYRGVTFSELDTPAVLERHPQVALVDELAHTNVPGTERAKRWEDVLDVLAAGIEVITTINVQHLESLNDVIAEVTDIRQRETVPDWVLGLADQVELVDMSPHALRRRMIHGNVYPDPRKAELALRRFFTLENLTALRELALMWVANQVNEDLLSRWAKGRVPETRERVLVCISRPGISEDLVRRGARIAQRAQGDLLVLHVRGDETAGEDGAWLADIDRLTRDLGGTFDVAASEDVVDAVLAYALRNHVTQVVVGEPLRSRWSEMVRGSVVNRLIRKASDIDIHVIARRER